MTLNDTLYKFYAVESKSLARLAAILREISPAISDVAAREAGKLYVLAHGALSLELDGRLQIITELSGREIALEAIRTTIRDLKGPEIEE